MTPRDTTSSSSSLSGGLSRAALHTLKDELLALDISTLSPQPDRRWRVVSADAMLAIVGQLDALLTAPSSQQEATHEAERAAWHRLFAALQAQRDGLQDQVDALTAYVRHYPNCRQSTHRLRACTCGLADRLTPASAEEPDK